MSSSIHIDTLKEETEVDSITIFPDNGSELRQNENFEW
jgi:hypothetical protein